MNKFSLLLFFSLVSLQSFGQSDIGLKFGMDIANVRNSNESDFTALLNFNIGVIAKFKLKDKFKLNTELLLANKGFNSILIPTGTTATNLTYISIPILLEHNVSKNFYLQLGPEFNYLIKASMKNSSFNESVEDNYKKIDLSIASGLGLSLSKTFVLEARYSLGLSQIRQNESIFGSYQTRTFQLNLIYNFRSQE